MKPPTELYAENEYASELRENICQSDYRKSKYCFQ